jgi:hypothetical protein
VGIQQMLVFLHLLLVQKEKVAYCLFGYAARIVNIRYLKPVWETVFLMMSSYSTKQWMKTSYSDNNTTN